MGGAHRMGCARHQRIRIGDGTITQLFWRWPGCLLEVEAVTHIVRGFQAGIPTCQAEVRNAKFEQADMRMRLLGDESGFRIGTEHQTPYPRPIAKLSAVGPLLKLRRREVIEPPTPIIPGDKNRDP